MFSALILAVGLTGQSGIGEPPANASPELRALYKQVNAEAAAARSSRAVAPAVAPAPVPAPVGQLPIPAVAPARKQVKLNTVNQPRVVLPPVATAASSSSVSKAQARRNYNAKFEAEEAAKAAAAARAAAVYNYLNTPNYMNVTRRSDGSFSTYTTTPGGQTEFKDYTPVIRTPRYGTGVGPSYLDWDVYTSQSQTIVRP